MKNSLLALLSFVCFSCSVDRELQAEMVDATLVKVEDIVRYPDIKKKLLTWKISETLTITSYDYSGINIPIGTVTKLLIKQ